VGLLRLALNPPNRLLDLFAIPAQSQKDMHRHSQTSQKPSEDIILPC
jgi:hypothetical protein